MASTSQDPLPDDDYNSASDEDFNPTTAPADSDGGASSSEEDESTSTRKPRTKRPAQDLDFDNSGDEATISKSKRKRKRKADAEDDEDEGGDGGLVKTRAQRKAEKQERAAPKVSGEASVDVDALWAQMQKGEVKAPEPETASTTAPSDHSKAAPSAPASTIATPATVPGEETVTITRTYAFAGETQTESRVVPASSAEAKLYLAQQAAASQPPPTSSSISARPPIPGLRRPTKRASMFDTPASLAAAAGASGAKGPKLNTLMKSKLDWAQHVDREGISDELDEAKKAKGGYLGKMDFLGRMDAKRGG